jgi:hypothetical protein
VQLARLYARAGVIKVKPVAGARAAVLVVLVQIAAYCHRGVSISRIVMVEK